MSKRIISFILILVMTCSGVAAFAEDAPVTQAPPPAVTWSTQKKEQETAELAAASVIDFDQRSIEVAQFMDEVNYKIYQDGSKVTQYRVNRRNITSDPVGFELETKAGQTVIAENLSNPNAPTERPTVVTGTTSIYNLIPYDVYQVTVKNSEGKVVNSFRIRPIGGTRFIKFNAITNFRDLGGMEGENGQAIRYGLLFRGGEIQNKAKEAIVQEDCNFLATTLGITKEIDLRLTSEASHTLTLQKRNGTEGLSQIPGAVYERYNVDSYLTAIDMSSPKEEYIEVIGALRSIFDSVMYEEPVYFHCSAGADRTEVIAFLIEGLLGVEEGDLDKDYELTSFAYTSQDRKKTYKPYIKMKDYLRTEFPGRTLQENIYNWFITAGFSADEIEQFKMVMLTR